MGKISDINYNDYNRKDRSVAIISFTEAGAKLARKIEGTLVKLHMKVSVEEKPFTCTLTEWTNRAFCEADALCFIGATGIAVRSIAPFLESKYVDAAVIVLDDMGKYCISLLSGHVGGANQLTEQIAQITGAIPVITTATDNHGYFAIDSFAREKNLTCIPTKGCKEIAAAFLEGKVIEIASDFRITGELPRQMKIKTKQASSSPKIVFTLYPKQEPDTLYLIPHIITVGIGCKKGTACEQIEDVVQQSLRMHEMQLQSIQQIASIDVKKEEAGLMEFTQKYKLPLVTYSAAELRKVEGSFAHSDFVEQTVGVDNVCERAAVLGSRNGTLIQRKTSFQGVTIALAMADWSVDFA